MTGSREVSESGFRKGLTKLTGENPADAHAYHVFPRKFAEKFQEAGIRYNDAKFGAWWEATEHLSKAKAYNAKWTSFFEAKSYRTPEEILNQGRDVKEHIH
ncbi:MAG: hypothetical protein PHU08_06905 [Dehalococcoidales bacterium]|nr:hypothetical protein [Dehalococcoidales bacterium]